MIRADLHTHTTLSDGKLAPAELLHAAATRELTHVAVCDHDTVAAYGRLQPGAVPSGLTLIPGVEISAQIDEHEVHILGLGFDLAHPRLLRTLANLADRRAKRLGAMFDKLVGLGCFQQGTLSDDAAREALRRELTDRRDLSADGRIVRDMPDAERAAHEATSKDGEAIVDPYSPPVACRLDLARALVRAGDTLDADESFGRFLRNGGPAHVPYSPYPGREAVEMIQEAGGLALLAHPALYKQRWEDAMREMARFGADGVEVVHPKQGAGWQARISALADTLGLRHRSGGSDFHAHGTRLSKHFGKSIVPAAAQDALLAALAHTFDPAARP